MGAERRPDGGLSPECRLRVLQTGACVLSRERGVGMAPGSEVRGFGSQGASCEGLRIIFKGAAGAWPGRQAPSAHFPRSTHPWFPPSRDLVGSEPKRPEING